MRFLVWTSVLWVRILDGEKETPGGKDDQNNTF